MIKFFATEELNATAAQKNLQGLFENNFIDVVEFRGFFEMLRVLFRVIERNLLIDP